MLVGNDIVDLDDPWSQPEKIHPRFDSRAFTTAERASLLVSRSTHRLRWSLWAAKESAFKVARKLDFGVRFLPRDFSVRMLDDSRAEVTHRLGQFRVCFERADQWLHAVATFDSDPSGPATSVACVGGGSTRSGGDGPRTQEVPVGVTSRIERVEAEGTGAPHGEDRPGLRVREVIQAAIGSLMDVASDEIRIVIEHGIPTLHRQVERLPMDVSLSHHGRFVACTWAVHGPL